jgi:hypothetical protein
VTGRNGGGCTVKELSKRKDVKWKEFFEQHFYKRALKRATDQLPKEMTEAQKKELVENTAKKIMDLMPRF